MRVDSVYKLRNVCDSIDKDCCFYDLEDSVLVI